MNDASTPHSAFRSPHSRLLYLFTRTPLHVGAGASVGAIDQPIIRERHTGFPVIPASGLKGTFADAWSDELKPNKKGELVRILKKSADDLVDYVAPNLTWLFGSDDANTAWAGAPQFSEAKLLAIPIRSAKGSFAWITCPLILTRAARDGVFPGLKPDGKPDPDYLPTREPTDEEGVWTGATLALDGRVVLEEYTFNRAKDGQTEVPMPAKLPAALAGLLPNDPVWQEVASRLVILSNGMMSFFAQNACEVAQHVKISDETGTAAGGALFNQENVPSETMFYSVLHAFDERTANKPKDQRRKADQALKAFQGQDEQGNDQPGKPRVRNGSVFQFGGDASTGLGYCTVKLADPVGSEKGQPSTVGGSSLPGSATAPSNLPDRKEVEQ